MFDLDGVLVDSEQLWNDAKRELVIVSGGDVVGRMERLYRERLPLLPGALEAVRSLGERWPLALASSSNREIIDLVLDLAGLADAFAATVSSEEVERGKPAPDVYLEAARLVGGGTEPLRGARGLEQWPAGRSRRGMAVIAVPNPHYPPDVDALVLAAATVDTVGVLTPELVERVGQQVHVAVEPKASTDD